MKSHGGGGGKGGDCHYKKGGVLQERLKLEKNSDLERF